MYERHRQPLLPRTLFVRRLLWHCACAVLLLAVSLALGMAGYEHYEYLPWRAAFENCAMLLGGMGPVDNPATDPGKVFAGLYALYAGLVFIASTSLVLAPVLHRLLHSFHSDERDK